MKQNAKKAASAGGAFLDGGAETFIWLGRLGWLVGPRGRHLYRPAYGYYPCRYAYGYGWGY
jgi:hypothetical protein